MTRPTTLHDAVEIARQAWLREVREGAIAQTTAAHYIRLLDDLLGFAAAHGVAGLDELDARLCRNWVRAPLSTAGPRARSRAGTPSAASTMRGRQTALRRAAEHWLTLGMLVVNPVPDDVIRPEGVDRPHPLTPPAVALLRLSGRVGLRDTMRPAMLRRPLPGPRNRESRLWSWRHLTPARLS